MEIPDELHCLFTAELQDGDGEAVIRVPEREISQGDLEAGDTYRVALLPTPDSTGGSRTGQASSTAGDGRSRQDPPVEAGERRTVEIESIGDQGDGIARVERGYVVIVPDTGVGDEVEVEIEDINPNFAMAQRVEEDTFTI